VDVPLASDQSSDSSVVQSEQRAKTLRFETRRPLGESSHPIVETRSRPLDALLTELLDGFARILTENPGIARRLTGLLAAESVPAAALLVSKGEYAARLTYLARGVQSP
jgi:hypothetical protein